MKIKIALTLLSALALLTAISAPRAWAQGGTPTSVNVVAEDEAARDLLQQAMRAYRQGDTQGAYKLARTAYLDHFENIEIPLRALNPDLTLDMEYRFADLRTKMQKNAPASEVETAVRSVRDGLNEIDAMFSDVGVLAPALAFGASFTIIFREGLEAVLVIAAVMGFLQSGGTRHGRRAVLMGVGLAMLMTIVTWVALRVLIQIAPVMRELLEAVISLVAVAVLFWVSFWLVQRLDRKRWMEFLSARASAAVASGSTLGLMGLGFTAVYREGFETALFYEVLFGLSQRVEMYIAAGFVVGAVALGVVAWLILRAGRKLPIRAFLQIAVFIVMALSVAFIGKAFQELQESGLINATSLIGIVPRLPRPVAEFTGIHPTLETLAAQIVLLLVYVGGYGVMQLKLRQPLISAKAHS